MNDIVLDCMPRVAAAIGGLAGWVRAGKIVDKVDVQHGLENALRCCGGCSKVATKASNCCVSPSSSPQQMGMASTTLSAEAASGKLEPSLAIGFN